MNLNLYVLITIFCWGIWGIADKKALETSTQVEVIVCLYFVTLCVTPAAVLTLSLLSPGWHLTGGTIFWTGLAALMYGPAIFAYMEAMNRTEASYVLGITASYPLILQFLAAAFLNEPLVAQRLVGALIITLGLAFVGASQGTGAEAHKGIVTKGSPLTLWLLVALATISWGVYGLFDKKALESGTPLEVYVSQRAWDCAALLLMMLVIKLKKHPISLRSRPTWLYCAGSGFALAVGGLCYLHALTLATASYVITITGCYPLLMYLFALLWLKEKFNRRRFTGIALIVAGGIAVQLTQS
jgi:drug/metabolite transporter (DMT)-like permease